VHGALSSHARPTEPTGCIPIHKPVKTHPLYPQKPILVGAGWVIGGYGYGSMSGHQQMLGMLQALVKRAAALHGMSEFLFIWAYFGSLHQ